MPVDGGLSAHIGVHELIGSISIRSGSDAFSAIIIVGAFVFPDECRHY